jgi:hypothetical protein
LEEKQNKVIGNKYQNASISQRANVDKREEEVLLVILMYLQPRQTPAKEDISVLGTPTKIRKSRKQIRFPPLPHFCELERKASKINGVYLKTSLRDAKLSGGPYCVPGTCLIVIYVCGPQGPQRASFRALGWKHQENTRKRQN